MEEFLRIVARALLDGLDANVLSDRPLQAPPDLAPVVWSAWMSQAGEPALRQALGEIASGGPDFAQALERVLSTQPTAGDIKGLRAYLGALPLFTRQAAPDLPLRGPEDLAPLLPPAAPHFEPGARPFGADWELRELLAIFPAGEAWKATPPRGAPVALYFLLSAAARAWLKGPAAAHLPSVLSLDKSPGFIPLEAVHAEADPPCLQYACPEATTLRSLLRDWRQKNARPDPLLVGQMIEQIGDALGPLHQRQPPLVHGHLRPENVLVIARADGRLECRVAEMGLGAWGSGAPLHRLGGEGLGVRGGEDRLDVYGEPRWLPRHPPRPSDDVYTLGMLWYQALVRDPRRGRPGGVRWRRDLLDEGMPPALLELLETCWEDDPDQRPPDGAALAREIAQRRKLAVTQPAPPPPAPAADKAEAPPRARPRRANLDKLFDSIEQTAPERSKSIVNTIGMKLTLIPAGTFLMGSTPEEKGHKPNEDPAHEVQVSNPFYLAAYPVTQEQYQKVMGLNPSRFTPTQGGGFDHPVENVSWEDAVEFCRRLSDLPEERGAKRRYRLPTEAEWEYACRGGTTTPFSCGATLGPGQANFDTMHPYGHADTAPPAQKTTPVAAFPPNNFGLYDMHGNVWEWCSDWLDAGYYRVSPRRDPPGPLRGSHRVLRGGSWRNQATTCRSAYRNGQAPTGKDMYTGFRVLLETP